jgi:Nif-specific regulatory protein
VTSGDSLEEAIADGTFLPAFLDLISGLVIRLPPLRERRSDLPTLIDFFLTRAAREHEKHVRGISRHAMDLLEAYEWPANVRELCVVLDRAVAVADGPLIHEYDLPADVRDAGQPVLTPGLIDAVDAYERELIEDALARARGVRSRAARLLKTTERIVNYKVRRLGIDCDRFKAPV